MDPMEKKLRDFLEQYIGRGELKKDKVTKESVDGLVEFAKDDGIEQDIIDYGTAHPEAPFWDFLKMLKPGLGEGVTEEDLLNDDE